MSQTNALRQPANLSNTDAQQLLFDLVSIPSPSRHEMEAVNFLVHWMKNKGYDNAYVDQAGSAVGIIGDGQRDIVLLGHIDTFGGNPPVKMDNRRLYGRGTVDAKGPLCAFAAAALQAQLQPDTRLIVIGAVEEEASSSKGARFATTQFQPDMCIIGEPSRWDRIAIGYKGRLLLEWNWYGAMAHSAGNVLSPAELAFQYWQNVSAYVDQFNRDKQRMFDRLDATIQEINTGQDGAYGWSKMLVGFRLPPGLDPEELSHALKPSNEAAMRAYGMEKAVICPKDSALSRAFRAAIRTEGGTPTFVQKTGTADMNVVARTWGCPMVAYGPGDSSLDHTPNEHVDIDEYLSTIRVLSAVLEQI